MLVTCIAKRSRAILPGQVEIVRLQQCQFADPGPKIVFVASHSVPDKTYELLIPDRDDPDPLTVICECEGYEFREHCTHQPEAIAQLCSWTETSAPEQSEQQRADMICPRCGAETEWVLLAIEDGG